MPPRGAEDVLKRDLSGCRRRRQKRAPSGERPVRSGAGAPGVGGAAEALGALKDKAARWESGAKAYAGAQGPHRHH